MSNSLKKTGIELIADERRRQIEEEGFDAKHDESHDYRVLIEAALAYAFGTIDEEYAKELFPEQWDERWWKPTRCRRWSLFCRHSTVWTHWECAYVR